MSFISVELCIYCIYCIYCIVFIYGISLNSIFLLYFAFQAKFLLMRHVIYHIFLLSIDNSLSNCIAVYCVITMRKYQPADIHLNLTFQGKLLSRHPWECPGELRPAHWHTPNGTLIKI